MAPIPIYLQMLVHLEVLLMIESEILHDLMYQDLRNYGSIVCAGSCRIYLISSRILVGKCWNTSGLRHSCRPRHRARKSAGEMRRLPWSLV